VHVVRRGTGKPLLMVHGLGSSLHNWDRVVPALESERELVLIDLPGFGQTPPLAGEASFSALTDALAQFVASEGLEHVDVVGSSMGARMVVELARRGHVGTTIALDPGGFWSDRQAKVFGASIKASVALVRRIQPLLPTLTSSPVGRTALLAQFSARPWALPAELVLTELRGFDASPSLDAALRSLVDGPRQQGAPAGALAGNLVLVWGKQDRVTLPSQAQTAVRLFPDASLRLLDGCGHFPHWDQPEQTVRLILDATT